MSLVGAGDCRVVLYPVAVWSAIGISGQDVGMLGARSLRPRPFIAGMQDPESVYAVEAA